MHQVKWSQMTMQRTCIFFSVNAACTTGGGFLNRLPANKSRCKCHCLFARDYLTGGSGDCAGANGALAGQWINNRKAVGKLNLAGERKINSDEFIVLKALLKCNNH
jgi:hypothetical protein